MYQVEPSPKHHLERADTPSVILSEGCVATESKFCIAQPKRSDAKPRAQRMAARSGICVGF